MSGKASRQAKREIDPADLTPERLTSEHIHAARLKAYSCGRNGLAGSLKKYENPDVWGAVCCASRAAIVSQIAGLYAPTS